LARSRSNPTDQHMAQAFCAVHDLSDPGDYRLANGSAPIYKETLVKGLISTRLSVWGPSGLLLCMLHTLRTRAHWRSVGRSTVAKCAVIAEL
jgi:hypothetical protein